MGITVKFFATFRQGRGKIMNIEIEQKSTVKEVLDKVEIEPEEVAILLVNGRDGKVDQLLEDGDTLSLFPPVGGG